MHRLPTIFAVLACLTVGLCPGAAQVLDLNPTYLAQYYWNASTSSFIQCPNTSTGEPFGSTPQAVVPAGFNASLGQWTPATSCNGVASPATVITPGAGIACTPQIGGVCTGAITLTASGGGGLPAGWTVTGSGSTQVVTAPGNIDAQTLGGVYQCDQYTGTTIVEQHDACMAAAQAAGGGTLDLRKLIPQTQPNCTSTPNLCIDHEWNANTLAAGNAGIAIAELWPATGWIVQNFTGGPIESAKIYPSSGGTGYTTGCTVNVAEAAGFPYTTAGATGGVLTVTASSGVVTTLAVTTPSSGFISSKYIVPTNGTCTGSGLIVNLQAQASAVNMNYRSTIKTDSVGAGATTMNIVPWSGLSGVVGDFLFSTDYYSGYVRQEGGIRATNPYSGISYSGGTVGIRVVVDSAKFDLLESSSGYDDGVRIDSACCTTSFHLLHADAGGSGYHPVIIGQGGVAPNVCTTNGSNVVTVPYGNFTAYSLGDTLQQGDATTIQFSGNPIVTGITNRTTLTVSLNATATTTGQSQCATPVIGAAGSGQTLDLHDPTINGSTMSVDFYGMVANKAGLGLENITVTSQANNINLYGGYAEYNTADNYTPMTRLGRSSGAVNIYGFNFNSAIAGKYAIVSNSIHPWSMFGGDAYAGILDQGVVITGSTNMVYAPGLGGTSSFAAPSASWPTWLVPTVTNPTSTPSLAVASSLSLANVAAGIMPYGSGAAADFSGVAQLVLPVHAGYTTAAYGEIGVDNTTHLWHWQTQAGDVVPFQVLTTTGSSGAATFTPSTGTLNIPQYASGSGMVWPTVAGIPYWTSGTAWGGAYNATTNIPPSYLGSGTPSSSNFLRGDGTWATPSGSGTVTSVALTAPSDETVTGSPITGSGTLAIARNSQTANLFLASPNGSSGVPSYRAIVAADIPTLNQNTTGTAANLSGTPTLPNGTAATTQTTGDATTKLATDAFVGASITANAYTLPTATSTVLGGVKPDGTTITISSGVISSVASGGGLSGMTAGQIPVAATATTVTSSMALQGTDASILTAGTISGTGASLCTDASGGATTSGCAGGSSAWSAITAGANTQTSAFSSTAPWTFSAAGALSASSVLFSGSPITTGGTGTTTFPLVAIWPAGATGPTSWSTLGTMLGINAPSSFTGNMIETHNNGGAINFAVSGTGKITSNSTANATQFLASTALGFANSSLTAGITLGPALVQIGNGTSGNTSGTLEAATIETSALTQIAASNTGGTCAMSSSTSCTITVGHTYTTPVCIVTQQSATLTGAASGCTVSGTTVTITSAVANSETWGALVFGNPN